MLDVFGIPPMETSNMSPEKELPLVRARIAALLNKTWANGCAPGEVATALEKARELVVKYELDPGAFRWPQKPSRPSRSSVLGSEAPKPPQAAAWGRGRGIGKLAERLIAAHPDQTYVAITAEVNRLVEGTTAYMKVGMRVANLTGFSCTSLRLDLYSFSSPLYSFFALR